MNHEVGHRHAAHEPLQFQNLVAAQDRNDFVHDERCRPSGDLELLVEARVLDEHLEHEPVLLRFGQRVGPFLLDRVLRGQDEERVAELVPRAADGHLPFLHGLQ